MQYKSCGFAEHAASQKIKKMQHFTCIHYASRHCLPVDQSSRTGRRFLLTQVRAHYCSPPPSEHANEQLGPVSVPEKQPSRKDTRQLRVVCMPQRLAGRCSLVLSQLADQLTTLRACWLTALAPNSSGRWTPVSSGLNCASPDSRFPHQGREGPLLAGGEGRHCLWVPTADSKTAVLAGQHHQ